MRQLRHLEEGQVGVDHVQFAQRLQHGGRRADAGAASPERARGALEDGDAMSESCQRDRRRATGDRAADDAYGEHAGMMHRLQGVAA